MSNDYKRQHESGTAKRIKRKKKEEDQKKMKGSMEGFLSRKATAKTEKLSQSGSSSLSSNSATPELINYFSGHNPKQNFPSHQHYMSESHHYRSVKNMLQYVISNNFSGAFPNVCIAFRIYLSILGSSCEGERSFSTLKRVKNYTRSTLGQYKMSSLALLCIESRMMKRLNRDEIIKNCIR